MKNKSTGTSSSKRQRPPPSSGAYPNQSTRQLHDVNAATVYRQEKFDICLLNARSVMSDKKGDDFKSFVEDSSFPIYAVTETWLPNAAATDQSFGPDLPNYTWLGQVGRANKPGGGVAWCVRDELFHKVKVIDTGLPLTDDYQVSHIQFDGLDLFCVYVVPGMKPGNHEEIFDYMATFNDRNAIFLGDFNLPGVDFSGGNTSGGRANSIFDHFCDKVTFQQLVSEPTREDNTLDLVFSSGPDVVDHVQVLPHINQLYGWDHRPVQITLTRFVESENDFKVSIKDFKKMDKELFLTTLRNANWSGTDPNSLQVKIRENIQEAIAVAIPSKEISYKKLMKQRQTSGDTIAATKLAAKLHHIYRQCPSVTNYNNYLDVNALKRALQRRDEDNYATTNVTKDAKTFWGFVNRATNKHRGIPTLVENDVEIDDDQGKADLFADGFMNVYKEKKLFTGPYEPTDPLTHRMPDFTFSVTKTKKAIKNMKTNSAPGVDGIGAKFYKLAIDIVAEPLTRLFQISYDTGIVPEEWKESMITALYKNKGPRSSKSSYRPISLLLVSFKLMEKSMKFDLCSFFDANELWSPCQHAFRSRRSTLTCLLEATDQVEKWLDDPTTLYAAYISLDAMKAFDAVTFDKLGRSLADQGLPEKGIRWFLAGLSERRFRVKVGGAFSSFKSPGSGIQQGAILSPICWNLHMQTLQAIVHDIPGAQDMCKLHIYADDVCLSFRSRGPTDEAILQRVLNRYEEIALEKSMHVHPEKSQILRIGKRSDTKFLISGKIIPEVDHMEALGVVLAANNKNDAHFQKVLTKVRQRVFLLRKSVQSTDVVVRTIVWDLMMGSIIRYGYPAIKEFNLTQLRKLQSLQRLWMSKVRSCALTCKHRRKRTPMPPALATQALESPHLTPCPKHVGPSPIFQTLAEEDLMVYYDLCTGKMNANISLPTYTKKCVRTRKTVLGGFLDPPPISKASRSKSYTHRIVKLVNSLPSDLRAGLEEIRDWKSSVRANSYLFDTSQDKKSSSSVDDAHYSQSRPRSKLAFNAWASGRISDVHLKDCRKPEPPYAQKPSLDGAPYSVDLAMNYGSPPSTEVSLHPKTTFPLEKNTTQCADFHYVWIFTHMQAVSNLAPASHRYPTEKRGGTLPFCECNTGNVSFPCFHRLDVASADCYFSICFTYENLRMGDIYGVPKSLQISWKTPRGYSAPTAQPWAAPGRLNANTSCSVSKTSYVHLDLLYELEHHFTQLLESLRGREISHMQAVSMALSAVHRTIQGRMSPTQISTAFRHSSRLDVAFTIMHYSAVSFFEMINKNVKSPMKPQYKKDGGFPRVGCAEQEDHEVDAQVAGHRSPYSVSTVQESTQEQILRLEQWFLYLRLTTSIFGYLHMQAVSKINNSNRRIPECGVTHHGKFQASLLSDIPLSWSGQLIFRGDSLCWSLPDPVNIHRKSCHSTTERCYYGPLRNLILNFAFLPTCHSSYATKRDNSFSIRPKLPGLPPAEKMIVPVFGTVNCSQSQLMSVKDNKANTLNNAFRNIPSLSSPSTPPASPPSFFDESKKFLSREAFKRGVRQDSSYRRPSSLDPERYKVRIALQEIQEIKGNSTYLLEGTLADKSLVRPRPDPFFL